MSDSSEGRVDRSPEPIPCTASRDSVPSTASLEAASPCSACGSPLYLDAAANTLACAACECSEAALGVSGTMALGSECFVDLYTGAVEFKLLAALGRARRNDSVFVPSTCHTDAAAAAATVFAELREEISWARHKDILPDGRLVTQPRSIAYQSDDASLVYSYEGIAAPLQPAPFTPCVRSLKSAVEQLCGGVTFNSAHLNLYSDGTEHVSWHTDEDVPLYGDAPTIASVSLGAERDFVLRRMTGEPYTASWLPCEPREHRKYVLRDGDVLVMRGATQRHFEHAVLKAGCEARGPRINITFRMARPLK
jgi:alpha-ketoglutarate-dependent dioxygenase alkB family protein 2